MIILARKIIFCGFVFIYLCVCPLLILYAFGFSLVPAGHQLTQTGVLYLATHPPGATVYLDQRPLKDKTPTTIQQLPPGRHQLLLTLPDHKSWQQTVNMTAGKAVSFDHILMVPYSWKNFSLSSESFSEMLPLEGTDYLLLSYGSRLGDYLLYDRNKETFRPVVSPGTIFSDFPVISILTQKGSSALVIYGGQFTDRKYLFCNLASDKEEVRDIGYLLPEKPLTIAWTTDNPAVLFAGYAGYLNRLDIDTEILNPRFVTDVIGFGLHKNRIYVLDSSLHIYRMSYDQHDIERLFANAALAERLFDRKSFYQLDFPASRLVTFLSSKGQLLVNRPPYVLIEAGVKGTAFEPAHSTLLYWTPQVIGRVNFNESSGGESLFEYEFEMVQIYRNGKSISQCFWDQEGSHIIFLDREQVFILELEPQGRDHLESIGTVKPGTSIFYSSHTGELFYLDAKDGTLRRTELFTRRPSLFVPLIEVEESKE